MVYPTMSNGSTFELMMPKENELTHHIEITPKMGVNNLDSSRGHQLTITTTFIDISITLTGKTTSDRNHSHLLNITWTSNRLVASVLCQLSALTRKSQFNITMPLDSHTACWPGRWAGLCNEIQYLTSLNYNALQHLRMQFALDDTLDAWKEGSTKHLDTRSAWVDKALNKESLGQERSCT